MKTALITGIRGQDGAYLASHLLHRGYRVVGADRRSGESSTWRLDYLDITRDIEIVYMDLTEFHNIAEVIETYKPDELYNLGAQSFVQSSFTQPFLTCDVNATGVLRILESIRKYSPQTRFYQASTSEMFGKVQEMPQSETTPFYPRSPYGVAKLNAHWMTVNYREAYNLFACCGILFNHESPLRGNEFVTQKIARHVACVQKKTNTEPLRLGNIDARRDWSHAADMVDGMHRMMQAQDPCDYVLSSGETHSVREFVEHAFQVIDIEIEWKGEGLYTIGVDADLGTILVTIDPKFYRPAEVDILLGDSTKARRELDWRPKIGFETLVEQMVREAVNEKSP